MKNTDNEIFTKLGQLLLKKEQSIVVVPHENPDGDAIGSAVGLAEVLQNQGQNVYIISPNNYPEFIKWFSSSVQITIFNEDKKKSKQLLKAADILICVDFNEAGRAGKLEKHILEFNNPRVLIDHHPNPSDFPDYLISEPQYSSTSELIFDVLENMNFVKYINKEAAEAFLTGIMTDTGSFSHNISNPNTFKVIARLMEFGIDIEQIQSNVYNNFSANRMKLLGYCLNDKMEVFPEWRSAFISISKKELEAFDYQPGDTEGFVNYPLSINNVVFSALFIEREDFIKASFRSKGEFPANEFSKKHFEGGGHLNAAGGESKLNLDETVAKFKQLLKQYEHQLKKTEI